MPSFALKIIACVSLLADGIGSALPLPWWTRCLGRASFFIFAFCAAESLNKTRDKFLYLCRLAAFAVITEIPFDLAFNQYGFYERIHVSFLDDTNSLFTLAFGAAAVYAFTEINKKRRPIAALAPVIIWPAAFAAVFFIKEPWWLGDLIFKACAVLFAALEIAVIKLLPESAERGNAADAAVKYLSVLPAAGFIIAAGAVGALHGAAGAALVPLFFLADPGSRLSRSLVCLSGVVWEYGQNVINTYYDTMTDAAVTAIDSYRLPLFIGALASVPIIAVYNGRRGKNVKWAFYAFSPAHVSIIVITAYIIAS